MHPNANSHDLQCKISALVPWVWSQKLGGEARKSKKEVSLTGCRVSYPARGLESTRRLALKVTQDGKTCNKVVSLLVFATNPTNKLDP
jgi:hypothetical protein